MAAANAGIADYNNALLKGYQDRNVAFASEQGGIPKDQASAAYDTARALEEPLEGQSSRGFRAMAQKQAAAGGGGIKASDYKEIEVPYGEPNQLGERATKKVLANPVTGEIFDPTAPKGQGVKMALYNALTPEEQSVTAKHFGDTKPTDQEFAAFIKTQFNK